MFDKLDAMKQRFNELTEEIGKSEVIANQELWQKLVKEHAELQEIVVARERRGQGLGGRLFSEAEKTAAAAGCLQLEVCCNRKRTDSHRFYERQGMAASHFKFTEVLGGQEQT